MLQATGAILTGGKSSRMGMDKALLPFGSGTLLEHAVRKMQALFSEVIIVGDDLKGHRYPGVRTIQDIRPGCGPLGGIHTALASAAYEFVFVAACDMPFWRPGLARLLLAACVGHDGAVPAYDGYFEPLLAAYGNTCLPIIEACLDHGRCKVSGFFDSARINFVERSLLNPVCNPVTDFYNINTITDLRNAPGQSDLARLGLVGSDLAQAAVVNPDGLPR